MLLLLLQYFHRLLKIKSTNPLAYSSTRMMLAAITTLILTIFLGPFFIKKLYEMKIGQTIRSKKECPLLAQLHEKKKDTPTMGGLLILSSMLISLLLWMDLTSSFAWILCITTIYLGGVGFIDDYYKLKYKNTKGISAKLKFTLQGIFAISFALYLLVPQITFALSGEKNCTPPIAKEEIVKKIPYKNRVVSEMKVLSTKEYISRIYVPFFKKPILLDSYSAILAFLFIIVVVIGASNAVNLTDGLDGLASGALMLVSAVFALVAFLSNHIEIARYLNILYIDGSGEIAIYLFALAGACLGFLWYNSYPAQIMMGDTGSLALGGILGVIAVLLKRELLLALVGIIFVVEVASVILQVFSYRYRNKKRMFLCAPMHHHFEYKGWAETKIVMRFWIIGLLFAIIGIASIKF